MTKIIGIIPARRHSKRFPGKSLHQFGGRPLVDYTLHRANSSTMLDDVFVYTDDQNLAKYVENQGVKTIPRCGIDALDASTDYDMFRNLLESWASMFDEAAEVFVHLRLTAPLRRATLIDDCVSTWLSSDGFDSLRTITQAPHTPYKMWQFAGDTNEIVPVIRGGNELGPYHSQGDQSLVRTYVQTASVDVFNVRCIKDCGDLVGGRCLGFLTSDPLIDINYEIDLKVGEILHAREIKTFFDT